MLSSLWLSWGQSLSLFLELCVVSEHYVSVPLVSSQESVQLWALSSSEKQTQVSPNLIFLKSANVSVSNKYCQSLSPKAIYFFHDSLGNVYLYPQHTETEAGQHESVGTLGCCTPSTQKAEVGQHESVGTLVCTELFCFLALVFALLS